MLLLAWLACGGDKTETDETGTTGTSGTTDTVSRCERKCTRGSDGEACDAAAIENACQNYCVDPPPLPAGCDPFYEAYERCLLPIDTFTCAGSTATVGDVTVPVPADPYECRLETTELSTCSAIPDPGCVPTLGGTGATCSVDMELCNAGGVTFEANLLCDGVICSLLVDDGTGPVDTVFPRADQLCAELSEQAGFGADDLARFMVSLTAL